MSLPVISARDLHRSYGRRRVLDGVELTVERASVVGIVGENGCGKSTLLQCLVGLLKPHRGVITVNGALGYCPQEPVLVDLLTCAEQFELFGAGYGLPAATARRRADELMGFFGCEAYRHTRVDRLSGGTRQKVNLIASLLHGPDVLFLDEPYQGFDHDTYLRFWDFAEGLRDEGKSLIVVSHMAADQERFDAILTMRDGRLEPARTAVAEGVTR